MSICKKCHRDAPVLQRASKPEAQYLVGMCKPCIQIEFRNIRKEMLEKIKNVVNDF